MPFSQSTIKQHNNKFQDFYLVRLRTYTGSISHLFRCFFVNISVDKYYLYSMSSIGQYIESLIAEGEHRQSDVARVIGVPRQALSYVGE